MYMTAVLRRHLESIRRLAGAATASLFLPPDPRLGTRALLLHVGDADPVPELADDGSAQQLPAMVPAEDARGNQGAPLAVVASVSGQGYLVQLCHAGDQVPFAAEPEPRTVPAERRGRPQSHGLTPPRACLWIGLSFEDMALAAASLMAVSASRAGGDRSPHCLAASMALSGPLIQSLYSVSCLLRDAVTDLPGRMQFQTTLSSGLKVCLQNGQSLGLLLVNPDDFGLVNQRLGRERGDAVLGEVAARMRLNLRRSDHLFRYGGAVFAVLLQDSEADGVKEVASKLRAVMGQDPYLQGSVRLSFSIGISTYRPSGADASIEPGLLLRWADAALNQAKLSGGGRAILWDSAGAAKTVGNLDRLSGIFTADTEKDYRNMLLLWDTVTFVSASNEPKTIASAFVKRLGDIFKPGRIILFGETAEGAPVPLASLSHDPDGSLADHTLPSGDRSDAQRELIASVRANRSIDRMRYTAVVGPAKRERSFIAYATPMLVRDTYVGCLYLEGPEDEINLDSSDLLFLNALTNQVAVALDQARLERERASERDQERVRLKDEVRGLRQVLQSSKLLYRSEQMQHLLETLGKVGPTDVTVLISGESGTGKEMLAKYVHETSPRRDKAFITVDCGAIAPSLIETELFGRIKGAFTGADSAARGRILEAGGGTLFLDEVGELPLEVQSKLLRFVQEKEITAVGATRWQKVDVRIVAATNRDLANEVAQGRFRQDLFYRLQVFVVRSLPLRQRPDDILPLARGFLERFSLQYGKGPRRLTPAAEEAMLAYPWPGNVRELQNKILQAIVVSNGEEIDASLLGLTASPFQMPRESPLISADPARAGPAAETGVDWPGGAAAGGVGATDVDPWEAFRRESSAQVSRALSRSPRKPDPLGRWINEDLVMLASETADSVARQAAFRLGMAESSFRRQLQKVETEARLGRLARPASWDSMGPILMRLLEDRGPTQDENLVIRARQALLAEVVVQVGAKDGPAAALMGVTPATYRRWKDDLQG